MFARVSVLGLILIISCPVSSSSLALGSLQSREFMLRLQKCVDDHPKHLLVQVPEKACSELVCLHLVKSLGEERWGDIFMLDFFLAESGFCLVLALSRL